MAVPKRIFGKTTFLKTHLFCYCRPSLTNKDKDKSSHDNFSKNCKIKFILCHECDMTDKEQHWKDMLQCLLLAFLSIIFQIYFLVIFPTTRACMYRHKKLIQPTIIFVDSMSPFAIKLIICLTPSTFITICLTSPDTYYL